MSLNTTLFSITTSPFSPSFSPFSPPAFFASTLALPFAPFAFAPAPGLFTFAPLLAPFVFAPALFEFEFAPLAPALRSPGSVPSRLRLRHAPGTSETQTSVAFMNTTSVPMCTKPAKWCGMGSCEVVRKSNEGRESVHEEENG